MLRASRSAFASRLHSLHTSSSCLAEALAGKEEILTDKDTYTNEDALTASNAVQPLDPSDPRVREITVPNGIAFPGDLRSSSGLGLGDKLTSHTSKWQQGNHKSPMDWSHEQEPIKVRGNVVASYGSEDPALGAPVEYIQLKGTTYDKPAVCKYTGNKYYSDDWAHHAGGH